MIAKLTGLVDEIFENYIILDVNGVGYRVEIGGIAETENSISLYIFTHVREQELRLFGFFSHKELALFENLLSVSGVGPKAAMTLVGGIGHDQILEAIATEDHKLLKAPGIGKKTAERIIIDLRNKIDFERMGVKRGKINNSSNQKLEEVTEALVQLGYTETEVSKVFEGVDVKDYEPETLLKLALKQLTRDVLR